MVEEREREGTGLGRVFQPRQRAPPAKVAHQHARPPAVLLGFIFLTDELALLVTLHVLSNFVAHA